MQAGPRAPAHEVFTRKIKIHLKIKLKGQALRGRTNGVRLLLDKWLAIARRAHVETTEFDSIGHYVKKGKRGACEQKAATVLPNRTAAT